MNEFSSCRPIEFHLDFGNEKSVFHPDHAAQLGLNINNAANFILDKIAPGSGALKRSSQMLAALASGLIAHENGHGHNDADAREKEMNESEHPIREKLLKAESGLVATYALRLRALDQLSQCPIDSASYGLFLATGMDPLIQHLAPHFQFSMTNFLEGKNPFVEDILFDGKSIELWSSFGHLSIPAKRRLLGGRNNKALKKYYFDTDVRFAQDNSKAKGIRNASLLFNFLDWRFWNAIYWTISDENFASLPWLQHLPLPHARPSAEGYEFSLHNVYHFFSASELSYGFIATLAPYEELFSGLGFSLGFSHVFKNFEIGFMGSYFQVLDSNNLFGDRYGFAADLDIPLNKIISLGAKLNYKVNEGHLTGFGARDGYGASLSFEIKL